MWITGQVCDDRGRALPEVKIEVSGACGNGRRTSMTNAHGHYVLQDLRPGAYTVTFARSGFSTLERHTDELTSYVATINARLQTSGQRSG
jgi:protocatechuate 3,4-dioxygenase beta subunit